MHLKFAFNSMHLKEDILIFNRQCNLQEIGKSSSTLDMRKIKLKTWCDVSCWLIILLFLKAVAFLTWFCFKLNLRPLIKT